MGESLQCHPYLRQSWCCVPVQNFKFVSPGRPYRLYEGEVEGSVTMLYSTQIIEAVRKGLEALSLALPTAEAKQYVSV